MALSRDVRQLSVVDHKVPIKPHCQAVALHKDNVLVTVRKKSEPNQVVLHVLNRDYDSEARTMTLLLNVEVSAVVVKSSETVPF